MEGLERGWPVTGLGCCTGACGFEPEATEEDQGVEYMYVCVITFLLLFNTIHHRCFPASCVCYLPYVVLQHNLD